MGAVCGVEFLPVGWDVGSGYHGVGLALPVRWDVGGGYGVHVGRRALVDPNAPARVEAMRYI